MRFLLLLLVSACGSVLAAGCEEDELTSADVVELQVCAGQLVTSEQCSQELIGNGKSYATVRVCAVVTDERRTDLVATVIASDGQFNKPKDAASPGIAEISLGAGRCGDVLLTAPKTLGDIRVEATLEGFRTEPIWLTVTPAPVDLVTLMPGAPELEPGESNSIEIAVHASGPNGAPLTVGSEVNVDLVPTPRNASVQAYPSKLLLDASGDAKFSLFASSRVSSVTVTATVRAPTTAAMPDPSFALETITLARPEEEDGAGGGAN